MHSLVCYIIRVGVIFMSDIELAYAAMAKIVYNFWPCFAFFFGYLLWEGMTEPKRVRVKKNNNIR